jgi:ABC-2 type transport system permease protein
VADLADALRLYVALIRASMRSQMQYRGAFLMSALGHGFLTATEVAGIWVLFDRFGSVGGWHLPEVALLYGLAQTSYALAEGVGRGFDTFAGMIRSGEFDIVLTRPRSTVLQVAGRQLLLRNIGRLGQGLLVLGWGASRLGITWGPDRIIILAGALVGGACLFYGLIVIAATVSFWTVESLEMFNILTYGGVETAQYPISIYRPWLRFGFIWIVPVAAVTYFPALAILRRTDPLGSTYAWQCAAPLLGPLFLAAALGCWRFGVRHYRSTGS